jgi:hypothetical protein
MQRLHRSVGGLLAAALCLSAASAVAQPLTQMRPAAPMQRQTQPQAQSQTQEPDGECQQIAGYTSECVRASAVDPRIRRFDRPSYALANPRAIPNGQLLVFLPGTKGVPPGPRNFLVAAADAGYRVISLDYNDDVSVAVYCPKRPNPECSGVFRRMRIFGTGTLGDASVDNSPEEAIVNRLVKLVAYLDRLHPGEGWGGFLDTSQNGGGRPAWGRIAVSGQSQGAGMAAFIAKEHAVARVILFSSPWDYVERGQGRELAPWIAGASRTPAARWFGGYHARENFARLIARSYAALQIPADHIRVFNKELPAGFRGRGNNPFHGQGVGNAAYAEERGFFLRAPAP